MSPVFIVTLFKKIQIIHDFLLFPQSHFTRFIKLLPFLWLPFIWGDNLDLEVAGDSAILMNAETGIVLFEKEAHTLQYPASTTKVATGLYALHRLGDRLDASVVAQADALASTTHEAKIKSDYGLPSHLLEVGGTHIGIKLNEEFSLRDLLAGMLIASGNDAANVLAQAVSGSIPRFMEELNAYLKTLGCIKTEFLNPHGLHHPAHQTTAYELALITKKALLHPFFCETVKQIRFLRPKTVKQAAASYVQTNRLLRPGALYYSKAIGVKTGYHQKAKKNLIAAAHQEGRTLIAVLLKYQDNKEIFRDAARLFEAAFNQPKVRKTYLKAGQSVRHILLTHAKTTLDIAVLEDLHVDYYPAEDPKPKCVVYLNALSPPIQKGATLGEVHLLSRDNQILAHSLLVAKNKVGLAWPNSWIRHVQLLVTTFPLLSALALVLFLFTLGGSFWLRRL